MNHQAEKAFQEMLDISTDIDKAVLFRGTGVLVSNFPEALQHAMVSKAEELAALGDQRASEMGSSPLTQMMVETGAGSVFLVKEAAAGGLGILATAKKDSRVGLVFYDMKTCIRDAQEEEAAGGGSASAAQPPETGTASTGEAVTE